MDTNVQNAFKNFVNVLAGDDIVKSGTNVRITSRLHDKLLATSTLFYFNGNVIDFVINVDDSVNSISFNGELVECEETCDLQDIRRYICDEAINHKLKDQINDASGQVSYFVTELLENIVGDESKSLVEKDGSTRIYPGPKTYYPLGSATLNKAMANVRSSSVTVEDDYVKPVSDDVPLSKVNNVIRRLQSVSCKKDVTLNIFSDIFRKKYHVFVGFDGPVRIFIPFSPKLGYFKFVVMYFDNYLDEFDELVVHLKKDRNYFITLEHIVKYFKTRCDRKTYNYNVTIT